MIAATVLAMGVFSTCIEAANGDSSYEKKSNIQIGVVNFKQCIEASKMGKQEQASFDGMKKQMESLLEDKEKALTDMAAKLNDADYLDSLTPEAERDLKNKFRTQSQEMQQQQNQYMQTLQQANYKILQKLTELVAKASAEVAQEEKLDLMLSEESNYYYNPALDVSSKVTAKMDVLFDKETKNLKK